MDTLRIRWNGGEATFEPGTTVRVGRDAEAQVQSRNTNVSRRHVEVTHTPSGWVLRDVGSAQGTWKDGRQIETVDVRGTVQVTLGREGRGEVLTLEASAVSPKFADATELPGQGPITGATQIVGMPPPNVASAAGIAGAGTVVVGAATPNRPGGALRAEAIAGATVVTGNTLNVECAGQSYSFQPGQEVSIGRGRAMRRRFEQSDRLPPPCPNHLRRLDMDAARRGIGQRDLHRRPADHRAKAGRIRRRLARRRGNR